MSPAIQKTISLILLIFIGYLLKTKIQSKEQMRGIKVLILSIALPATIFVALLKINFDISLFYLPIFALGINLLLFLIIKYAMPIFGYQKDSSEARTIRMLFPSLAPGLSCFPFLVEYINDEALALAALADVGNKVFVLVILYLIAMNWHFKIQKARKKSTGDKVRGLLLSLVKEPVNLVMITALIMLYAGANLQSIPGFLQDPIQRMSLLMTPMVLLFIGMSVKINWQQFKKIGSILVFRSAIAFLLSAILLLVLPGSLSMALSIVIVVFPQSAASFWPFAHISLITDSEKGKDKTFDSELALNFLALSLPFSTVIILLLCNMPQLFIKPGNLFLIAGTSLALILLPKLSQVLKRSKKEAPVWNTTKEQILLSE